MIKQNDPRRWQERADARMIAEDPVAMANLSPIPINREMPHQHPTWDPATGMKMMTEDLTIAFFAGVKGKR